MTATEQKARDLVFPCANEARLLQGYLRRRVPRGDARGALVVEAIVTLDRCERLLRSMYTPTYDGL